MVDTSQIKTDLPQNVDIQAKSRLLVSYAARPVVFSQCAGIFHFPDENNLTDKAVLFLSPWGMEELCTRKLQRIMAERLSDVGIASLRFDYPGTGDSLDPDGSDAGAEVWIQSVVDAAQTLRASSGCRKLVVIAQGLGCIMACEALTKAGKIDALVMMAPVVSGRNYLRETAMWSSMIDDGLGLPADQRLKDPGSIAGLVMPAGVADAIKKINLLKLETIPSSDCLFVTRPERIAEDDLLKHFKALDAKADAIVFAGYDALVSSPTQSIIPDGLVENIVSWVKERSEPCADRAHHAGQPENAVLDGAGFTETPVQFGERGRLFGVVCQPLGQPRGANVVFLNSAYDRHSGWGRLTARMARDLAKEGITSLRFDGANIADSPPLPGVPQQVLYEEAQNIDVIEAVDFMQRRGKRPVIAAGRCSGAFVAFSSALADDRIRGAIVVNADCFRWEKGRSVEDSLDHKPRSFGEYRERMLNRGTFTRILKGEVDLPSAAINIGKAVGKQIGVRTARLFRSHNEFGRSVYAAFDTLKAQKTKVALLYSENDAGLDHFNYYFDVSGRGLKAYPNVSFAIIPNADHNLSPEHARKIYLDKVRELALAVD
ncbi:alpha/beta fold hydrolase [Rhizobium sp. CG4]|uniref:alpha/beta fold hydrolase n=1 Tax=Rhizobium sp. CG4 TaxID=2726075 RepID=UPI002033DE4A|nr:alpha/beta fold hydrolase [Rhizobium sp. CG4]MCM2457080.1 alpha/beta fold hydrolase [Rhizobium sp. CG4]